MLLYLKTLLTTFAFMLVFSKNCNLLPDGTYTVKYSVDSNESVSKLIIKNNSFNWKSQNGDTSSGNIIWLYDCRFKLEDVDSSKTDTTKLEQVLLRSFGERIFELQSKRSDIVFFRTTYRGNLHLTTGEGYFVKVN